MRSSEFYFLGQGPFSKSLLNRALIVKSWFPHFSIKGTSNCDDVQIMEKAITNINKKTTFHCGFSGTAFRFLSLCLSRKKGTFFFTGEPALWSRPFKDLKIVLSQLGVNLSKEGPRWRLSSEGWNPQGDYLNIPGETTSQCASALILNSWNLQKDIYFSLSRGQVSYPYFQMTLDFVRKLGLNIKESAREYQITKEQTLKTFEYIPEQDKSCLFFLGSLAALKGKSIFKPWEENSLQPDSIFPEILETMGVSVNFTENQLIISQTENLKPLSMNLKSYPDLFPVLSVLCAKAEGLSQLSGLQHLVL